MDLDVDEVIASANDLISSIYQDLGISPSRRSNNRRSSVTVSPEVQRDIDRIDRYIQEVPSAAVERQEPEQQPDNQSGAPSVPEVLPDDSVQIINTPDLPQSIRQIPSRRRNSWQARLEDIIDLCSDSETNRITARHPRPSEPIEVINLVSPASNQSHRRSRCLPPGGKAVFHVENDQENHPKPPDTKNEEITCAICMESYISREPTATKCGHIFCKSCIVQALQQGQPKCPICRSKITARTLLRLHF